jgi:diacylglycerol kinase (CTP)
LNPESTTPLLRTLLVVLTVITSTDLIRFNSPAFNAVYIKYLGKLMRREEEGGWNGTIPYLVGICWVLGFYPREVVVVGVLT